MHLNEMNKRLELEGPFVWCDPWEVDGVNFAVVKSCNERRWFSPVSAEELEETPDEVIVEYLAAALTREHVQRKNIDPDLRVDGVRLIKAVVFLVCQAGSSYAAIVLGMRRKLVERENARECLDLLANAYGASTSFVRDILRDFIIDVFGFGPLWEEEPYGGRFRDLWTEQELAFLHHVFDDGYLTIDKEDASLFVDGTKRW